MPAQLTCPSCGQATFPWWRKQMLGPARTVRCPRCKARVSVNWRAAFPVFVLIPLSIYLAFIVARSEPFYLRLLILTVGGMLAVFLYHRFMPLIVRGGP
jgi:uncharacterized paraquat-inducible protein A